MVSSKVWIAHRGIYNGTGNENSPIQIASALQAGFEVEVDIRFIHGRYYLGHDSAQYEVHPHWLLNTRIWFHCKTLETLEALMHNQCSKVFIHDNDEATIAVDTGSPAKWIWTHPNTKVLTKRSIAVMPERSSWTKEQLEGCAGVCSDYVAEYKRDLGFRPQPVVKTADIDPVDASQAHSVQP